MFSYSFDDFYCFHNYLHITGWIYHESLELNELAVLYGEEPVATARIALPSPDLPDLPPNRRFEASLVKADPDWSRIQLQFNFSDGSSERVSHSDLVHRSRLHDEDKSLARFKLEIATPGFDTLLELGSRARSGNVYRSEFGDKRYVGFDIMPGDNVDVVGDAHEVSKYFQPEQFDAIFSTSTFEHLLMPWKVVIEMNKILRIGGVVFVGSHQTLGMHDMPWDFWRFSNTAWSALFNRATGFEILETSLAIPLHIGPYVWWEHWRNHERSGGFANSGVVARKIGPTSLEWNVSLPEVVATVYPE